MGGTALGWARAHAARCHAASVSRRNFRSIGEIKMHHGLIVWLIIGALAGWLAGVIMKGGGFGLIVDIIVGIVGAFVGGWLASILHINIGGGFISSLIVAVIGAVVLLFVIRLVRRAV
jgi:uncharacterized membrane protein YeaQ/YmgE (transglycosylase-associated protein family)